MSISTRIQHLATNNLHYFFLTIENQSVMERLFLHTPTDTLHIISTFLTLILSLHINQGQNPHFLLYELSLNNIIFKEN